MNLVVRTIKANHLANAVAKTVIGGLRQVVDRFMADIHRTGCHFMQMRLPDMGAGAINVMGLPFQLRAFDRSQQRR
jgi:hypothetical protein